MTDARARCETARKRKRKLPYLSLYCTETGELRWRVRVPKRRRGDGAATREHWDAAFASEREAVAYRDQKLLSPEEQAAATTVREYLEESWLPHYRATFRPSSVTTTTSHVRVHIIPMFGEKRLGRLTRGDIIRAFDARRASGAMSGQTARQVHSTFRAALNQAVRWELLAQNPASGVRISGVARKERKPIWSLDQFQAFMVTQAPPWSVLWALLAATGMRISEALALRWEDVTFTPRAVIQIRRTVARGEGGYYEDSPKSAAGQRPIVMGPELAAMLVAWREEQAALPRRVGAQEPVYVFGTVSGGRRTYSGVKQRLEAEIARCGLPPITLHALRHMSATEQLAAGVPLKVVSARLGHAKVALTADLYSHVLDEHQQSAAAITDVFLGQRDMGVPWSEENPDNQAEV